jgi:hypothetical protein
MMTPRGTRDDDDEWTTGSDEENSLRDVVDITWAYSMFFFYVLFFFYLLFISY